MTYHFLVAITAREGLASVESPFTETDVAHEIESNLASVWRNAAVSVSALSRRVGKHYAQQLQDKPAVDALNNAPLVLAADEGLTSALRLLRRIDELTATIDNLK